MPSCRLRQPSGAAATVNLKTTPGPAELLKISGGGLAHMVDFVGAPATSQLALPALLQGRADWWWWACSAARCRCRCRRWRCARCPCAARPSATPRRSANWCRLVRDGKLKLPAVQVRPLAQAEAALRDLEAGKVVGRVVLDTAEV